METCKAKRGFFSLRDCGEPASKKCALCSRSMCTQHLSPGSGYSRCLDCDARSAEKAAVGAPKGQKPPAEEPLTDPTWPYRYRSRYYRTSHYAPFYTGYYYDPYYNDYDLRSFDSRMASRGPAAAADHERTDFGDS
jgi:hypothetical protein